MKKLLQSNYTAWALRIIIGLCVLFGFFFISIYIGIWGHVPTRNELCEISQSEASEVYDMNGKLIGKFYLFDRQSIDYNEIPQNLIHALVATEDFRFYNHHGVDYPSLCRVLVKSILMQNDASGGGSTITQQLAKNLYHRKDYGKLGIVVNKFREMIIAGRLEDVYSKKQILTLYLNTVPFSGNTYGIESASNKFFNKHAKDLSLDEAALIVGMLKANYYYNPKVHPQRSITRRNVVLHQMLKYNFIDKATAIANQKKPLKLNYHGYDFDEGIAPYFRERVRRQLIAWSKDHKKEDGSPYNLYKDGLKIYTTLDANMQSIAENAMTEHMKTLQADFEKSYGKRAPWLTNKKLLEDVITSSDAYQTFQKEGLSKKAIMDSLNTPHEVELFNWDKNQLAKASTIDSLKHYLKFLNAGMIAVDPSDGAIRSYIGGINYKYFKYDHVSQSKRQVGSTFKPFVYTTAVERGIGPCKYYSPQAVTYDDFNGWTPQNASVTEQEDDPFVNYSMKYALSHSVNTVAVKVLEDAGIGNTIKLVHQLGITSNLPHVPSLALGTADLSVKEMAGAYASYVNHSTPVTPYFITKIEDDKGNTLEDFVKNNDNKEEKTKPVYSERTREILIKMMEGTVNSGTAARIRYKYGLNNDIAGKTGTTQNNRDGWFVGITPKLVTVTWVGSDDQRIRFRTTHMGQGANSALPIFALTYKKMNEEKTFDNYTKAHFSFHNEDAIALNDCPDKERDDFFERLFNPKKRETNESKAGNEKKKKGFFGRLFGGAK
ncbi:penicillin-binding protein 1A [Zhouia sp. PK063]|uniref:penicillin-binding protein 1A n=1 Tax=Zhouia sp. PK063 TaxID=3373602 RepID=UPI00378EDA83